VLNCYSLGPLSLAGPLFWRSFNMAACTALLHLAFIRLHLLTAALPLSGPSRSVSFPRLNHQCWPAKSYAVGNNSVLLVHFFIVFLWRRRWRRRRRRCLLLLLLLFKFFFVVLCCVFFFDVLLFCVRFVFVGCLLIHTQEKKLVNCLYYRFFIFGKI